MTKKITDLEGRFDAAMKRAAITLGTLGGKARTKKKALSSRKNGMRGGRPKKNEKETH